MREDFSRAFVNLGADDGTDTTDYKQLGNLSPYNICELLSRS